MPCHSCFDGSGGRGWTERSEGSPGVSGWCPPTQATHPSIADRAQVLGQSCFDGSGGRGWTERIEGSPGVSGWRPPTPATHRSIAAIALAGCSRGEQSTPLSHTFPPDGDQPQAVLSGTRHADGDMLSETFVPTPLPRLIRSTPRGQK